MAEGVLPNQAELTVTGNLPDVLQKFAAYGIQDLEVRPQSLEELFLQYYEDGRQEYEIEFVTADTKYEYEIKADDGAVLKASAEPVEKISGNGQMQGGITLEEAKAAALAYVGVEEGTSSFTKLELDYDDGTAVYEIEFYADGKEYSFEIDALSGKVLEAEMENN